MNEKQVTPPPAVSILGIGAVTPFGRDLEKIAGILAGNAPATRGMHAVRDDFFEERGLDERSLRRADRFIRMAAAAALSAWSESGGPGGLIAPEQTGLIVTSGLGPHSRGFRFLDGILDAGDSEALPTDFSHSVHGAAASYIAGLFDLRGPSLTATDFEIGFEQAVLLAQTWLQQGICRRVLVGAVDELGEPMLSISAHLLKGNDAVIRAEGSVFVMLGPAGTPGLAMVDAATVPEQTDLLVVEHPPILATNESSVTVKSARTVTFTPWFGHSATSSAMAWLGGTLSVLHHRALGKTLSGGTSAGVDNATTLRTSCGDAVTLHTFGHH